MVVAFDASPLPIVSSVPPIIRCANPLIVFALPHAPWSFLLCPTLAGAALIVVVALFYHNLRRTAPWPKYWL